jgi:hypothetical protein
VGELAGGDKVSILGQPAGGADDAATDASMARIAAAVTAELSVPVSLLDGYLQALVAVSGSGRRLTAGELEVCGQHGQEAVRLGVPLPVLVDTYLTVTWQAWDELPAARAAGDLKRLRLVTRAVLRAAAATWSCWWSGPSGSGWGSAAVIWWRWPGPGSR